MSSGSPRKNPGFPINALPPIIFPKPSCSHRRELTQPFLMLISLADSSGDGHSELPSASSPRPSTDKSSACCHPRSPYRKALISSLITTELFEGLHLTASSTTWLCSTKLQAAPYGPPSSPWCFSPSLHPPPKNTNQFHSETSQPVGHTLGPWLSSQHQDLEPISARANTQQCLT